MDIFRIIGIGISAAVLSLLLKERRPELALQISLLATAVIFLMSVPHIRAVIAMFEEISSEIGIDIKYILLVMNVIRTAYVAQFGAELCRDAGEGAIAAGIELAGKVLIMTISMPVVYSLLETVETIIKSG